MIAPTTTSRRRCGVALVIVLWVLVVLTALCLAMNGWVRSQSWRVGRSRDGERVCQAMASGLAMARGVLATDADAVDCLSEPWANPADPRFDENVNGAAVVLFAPDPATGATPCGLADEAARLNANTATVAMLARLNGFDAASAAAFVAARTDLDAHIDASSAMPAGPARGSTGPISSPGQLARLVRNAVDPSGVAAAMTPTRPWENPRNLPQGAAQLMTRLTIYTEVRNRSADGEPRIHLNSASRQDLTDRLGGVLDADQITAIITHRPLGGVGDLLTRSLSVPRAGGGSRPITISRAEFRGVVDLMTTVSASVLLGRVNVNTAGREVLRCVPGMTPQAIDAIVAYRQQASPVTLSTLGWLLDGVLTPQQFAVAVEYLTTRSRQFRAHIACRRSPKGPATYAEAVLTRGATHPGVLYLESYAGIWDDPR